MQLNHLDLPVPDIGAVAGFLQTHLGLRCLQQRADFALLTDGHGFGLVLSPWPAGQAPGWPGDFHLGFNQPTAEAVQRLWAQLQAAGVPMGRPLGWQGPALSFVCLAPGGLPVEVGFRPGA